MSGLYTERLGVGYGKAILIDDISIAVEPGKIMTLIGPNGSGKSTILKTISGQLSTMGGAVYLDGRDMKALDGTEKARRLSMVMTGGMKTEYMTCRDVVATGRYPYTGHLGILSSEDRDKVEQALSTMNALEIADRDFSRISDGQRQRIMLARAFCQDTGVLVLDEPTSYLDIKYKVDILELIKAMVREKNLAVIMALHELDLAKLISDTIVCVGEGKIQHVGTPEEIFNGDIVSDLFGMDPAKFDARTGTVRPDAFL